MSAQASLTNLKRVSSVASYPDGAGLHAYPSLGVSCFSYRCRTGPTRKQRTASARRYSPLGSVWADISCLVAVEAVVDRSRQSAPARPRPRPCALARFLARSLTLIPDSALCAATPREPVELQLVHRDFSRLSSCGKQAFFIFALCIHMPGARMNAVGRCTNTLSRRVSSTSCCAASFVAASFLRSRSYLHGTRQTAHSPSHLLTRPPLTRLPPARPPGCNWWIACPCFLGCPNAILPGRGAARAHESRSRPPHR